MSGKNPNVMFELGVRLAFDKPTIIVKDDATSYSFDTAPIEHVEYPRDLRFNKIVSFSDILRDKIKGTHKKATEDTSYTTFLKHFGQFQVAQLETTEVSKEDFIIEELRDQKRLLYRLSRRDREDILSRGLHGVGKSLRSSQYSDEAIGDMRGAVSSALDYFRNEGREVELPDMEHEIRQYVLMNGDLKHHFESRGDFDRCFDSVLYQRNV